MTSPPFVPAPSCPNHLKYKVLMFIDGAPKQPDAGSAPSMAMRSLMSPSTYGGSTAMCSDNLPLRIRMGCGGSPGSSTAVLMASVALVALWARVPIVSANDCGPGIGSCGPTLCCSRFLWCGTSADHCSGSQGAWCE